MNFHEVWKGILGIVNWDTFNYINRLITLSTIPLSGVHYNYKDHFFNQISLTGSVWTTMAVSVERYMTVCLSYRSQFFVSISFFVCVFVSVFVVVVVIFVLFFVVKTVCLNYRSQFFWKSFYFAIVVAVFVVVVVLLLLMMFLMKRQLLKSNFWMLLLMFLLMELVLNKSQFWSYL